MWAWKETGDAKSMSGAAPVGDSEEIGYERVL